MTPHLDLSALATEESLQRRQANSLLSNEVRVVEASSCLGHLETIIAWHREEWGDEWAEYARGAALGTGLPTMYVAMHGENPIGTSLLTHEDLPTRKDLFPWLAGVYVLEEWRSAGVGMLLTKFAMKRALALELPELFLFVHHAPLQRFYGKLGWVFQEENLLHGEPVYIMRWTPCVIDT